MKIRSGCEALEMKKELFLVAKTGLKDQQEQCLELEEEIGVGGGGEVGAWGA